VNWKLNRISKVNLSILRLGTYEIIYKEDIPGLVAVNEAIELSKLYTDANSVGFINSVLDKILKSN
jgi:N utilization substance protein B